MDRATRAREAITLPGEDARMSSAVGYDRLKLRLAAMKSVVVAYSGGVDSSLVLAAAQDALGDKALAVTACSPTYSDRERDLAVAVARNLGARHVLIDSHEFDDASYRENPPDRCYFCKRELFARLRAVADAEGLAVIVDGANADDEHDFRPGHRAARELGVRSPLAELGFNKGRVRELARDRGLPNWGQPSCACLASRIPYGVEITPARLARVAGAEEAIQALGFKVVRVRDHGTLARVEVGPDELALTLSPEVRQGLIEACRLQGFTYVCLDLEGYRTGSMNAVIAGGGAGEMS